MHASLIPLLAQPGTGAPLELEGAREESGEIVAGTLVSTADGARYPIVRGIPRFLPAESYAGSFGLQWNRFREVQLDSEDGARLSEARFDAETGWDRLDLAGQTVLDAGCGAGRFSEVAAARGARLVALDCSSAVEAARETLRGRGTVDLVQGDLLDPPFRRGAFDRAYCIGVVQHTPDPQRVIRRVVDLVRPGGRWCFTIYARRPWTRLHAKYLVRPLTRRLPTKLLLDAIEAAMPVAFPVTDRLFRVPVLGRVARFGLPIAVYTDRDHLPRERRYQEAVLDTLDMLSPRYDSPMTAEEVESALAAFPSATWRFQTRVPINVVGVR